MHPLPAAGDGTISVVLEELPDHQSGDCNDHSASCGPSPLMLFAEFFETTPGIKPLDILLGSGILFYQFACKGGVG
jgi:hypothetical protein